MKTYKLITFSLLLTILGSQANAKDDSRELVELPEMMQQHMLANMRDHLNTINQLLVNINNGELDQAADIAEQRLGMSSLNQHRAAHMAKFMPVPMQQAGMAMHKAASRLALKAQEGDTPATYKALANITAACVSCHASYKIK